MTTVSKRRTLIAVPLIAALNAVIYVVANQSQDHLVPYYLYADTGWHSLVSGNLGVIVSIFTAAFIQLTPVHFFTNMAGLLFAGLPLERLLGTKRFIALYAAGILASALGYLVVHGAFVVPIHEATIGASGGIAALMAALLVYWFDAEVVTFDEIGWATFFVSFANGALIIAGFPEYALGLMLLLLFGTIALPLVLPKTRWHLLLIVGSIGSFILQNLNPLAELTADNAMTAHSVHFVGLIFGALLFLIWKPWRARTGSAG